MHATSVITSIISLFAAGTLANWNPRICDGAGGCLGIAWFPDYGFKCPNGLALSRQQVARETTQLEGGVYDHVTAQEFPTTCLRGVKPGANDDRVVFTTSNGLKMYTYISETCRETAPEADCYNQYPNPSSYTICQIETPEGEACSLDKSST